MKKIHETLFLFALLFAAIMPSNRAFAQATMTFQSGTPSHATTTPSPGAPEPGFDQALQQVQQMPQMLGQLPLCPACPPCATAAPATTAAAAAPVATAPQAPADPCASYQTQDGYIFCRDRLIKLQRMQKYKDNQIKAQQDYEKARAAAKEAQGNKKKPIEQAIGIPQPLQPQDAGTQTPETTTKKATLRN